MLLAKACLERTACRILQWRSDLQGSAGTLVLELKLQDAKAIEKR
jgi:hypothetical protein